MPISRDMLRQNFRVPAVIERTVFQTPPLDDLLDIVADEIPGIFSDFDRSDEAFQEHIRTEIDEAQTYADLINVVEKQMDRVKQHRDDGRPFSWDKVGRQARQAPGGDPGD